MLKRVHERFGDREVIPIKEVAEWIGCSDRHLKNDKKFPIKKIGGRYYATATGTARFLA